MKSKKIMVKKTKGGVTNGKSKEKM